MDEAAQQTRELRSFYHQFPANRVPTDYYDCLRGRYTARELLDAYPDEAEEARSRSLLWELGRVPQYSDKALHKNIGKALGGSESWVLVGGPPCQAYSTIGRARNKLKKGYDPSTDERSFLYLEYLKIIGRHWPAVFLMENVTGVQSSSVNGRNVWHQMLADLGNPAEALKDDKISAKRRYDGYRLYSLTIPFLELDIFGLPTLDPSDYIVKCEQHGVPQARHRVFVLGVRADIATEPGTLRTMQTVTAADVLDGLPRLRSGITDYEDSGEEWFRILKDAPRRKWWSDVEKTLPEVTEELKSTLKKLGSVPLKRGDNFVKGKVKVRYRPDWYLDKHLHGACNHHTKAHMSTDLHRYLFAAGFAKRLSQPLRLGHFPKELLPAHENAKDTHKNAAHWHQGFADRFGAIAANQPSRTVMSHLAKDGHYYIHYDLTQCRSLTVREAARLQTFPDNYYFCGNKGQQYRQIGNAVPPLLSQQIAEIILKLFTSERTRH
jgi:DNA (cytosine-5)-methyltransferase 1